MPPEIRLLLRMLPLIERLAPTAPEAALVRDEAQAYFDAQSAPLRDAIQAWGRGRGVHFCCVSWCADARRWRFESQDFPLVEVDEIGTRVWVGGEELRVKSAAPLSVKRALTKLLRDKMHR